MILNNIVSFQNGKGHESLVDENGHYILINSKFISTDGEVKKCCEEHNGTLLDTKWTKAKDTYHFKCNNPDHPIFENTADGIMNKKQWCPYCSGRKGNFNQKVEEII